MFFTVYAPIGSGACAHEGGEAAAATGGRPAYFGDAPAGAGRCRGCRRRGDSAAAATGRLRLPHGRGASYDVGTFRAAVLLESIPELPTPRRGSVTPLLAEGHEALE